MDCPIFNQYLFPPYLLLLIYIRKSGNAALTLIKIDRGSPHVLFRLLQLPTEAYSCGLHSLRSPSWRPSVSWQLRRGCRGTRAAEGSHDPRSAALSRDAAT